jgi:glycosyltransferase involved in cell wall biosynthesis
MTADTIGGVWTYAIELARALAPHGVEIDLATMGAPLDIGQRREAAATRNLEVHESNFRLEWMADPWDDVRRSGEWLLHLAEETHPDLVHLNGYAHGALPWAVPTIVVGHSCVLSWWRAVKGGEAPDEWDAYRRAVTAGLRAASAVAAPSRAMLESLERDYGPLTRTGVIANARAVDAYRPGRKMPIVLTVGRVWDEAKNAAAVSAAADGLPWSVYIAGDTRSPDGTQRVFGNVFALGRLSSDVLGGWLSRASIFALPARYEPFGLSSLEAALAGCALVLGDIPSLREVWGDAALFVAPDDVAALRSTLELLIANDAERLRMAERARERALTYAPARMAEEYLGLYRAVAGTGVREEVTTCAS